MLQSTGPGVSCAASISVSCRMSMRVSQWRSETLLEVARALIASPRLLLLDEPTAGVHPNMIGELQRQLILLRDEEGLAMLMIEHELGIVEGVCQRVIVTARGRVIAEGGLAEVRGMPQVREAYVAG